jgi:6-phosphogluconolactonase (cycloisomerase 2 family)
MKIDHAESAVVASTGADAAAQGTAQNGRRTFLKHAAGGITALAAAGWPQSQTNAAESDGPQYIYTGSFTTKERGARGIGIGVYRMEQSGGAWTPVQALETVANPQFICMDRTQRFLYSVHGDGTEVSAYAIDRASGRIAFLNKQATNGVNSTHLTPDPGNRYLVIGNGPGVAVFPMREDGSLAPFSDMAPSTGELGPQLTQQREGAHPHFVVFDPGGRFLVACDRGTDRLLVYKLNPANGKLTANELPFVRNRAGAGPRHLAFHPTQPWAYVCNELDSTVTAYQWNGELGEFKPFQIVPAAPMNYTGNNSPAEIMAAPSGKFIYVSNRGHDSIATYAVDPGSGNLGPIGWESTRGTTPRFFTLAADGAMLYAANLASHNIVAYRVDQATGRLTATGQVIETGSPSCIVFRSASA